MATINVYPSKRESVMGVPIQVSRALLTCCNYYGFVQGFIIESDIVNKTTCCIKVSWPRKTTKS